MAGQLPQEPCFAAVNMRSNKPGVTTESITLRRQTRKFSGHRWELTARYDPMNRTEFGPIDGFLEAQDGDSGLFTVIIPVLSEHSGNVASNVAVVGAHPVGTTVIPVDGFTGTLPAGDYIKFDNHNKVYKITEDRAGPGDLSIRPALKEALTDNEGVIYNNVPFLMRQVGNVQEYEVSPGVKFQFEVDLVEDA